ncbi:MAG: transposase, partial [Desulfobacterales bacterium]|nr:transposase [Desulfobacterales bacterium]
MNKPTSRKKYPEEFKNDAINLVKTAGYSRAEAARRLDISA